MDLTVDMTKIGDKLDRMILIFLTFKINSPELERLGPLCYCRKE